MKYAIIQLSGHQYFVEENGEFTAEVVSQEEGKTFEVTDVLMVGNGDTKTIGTPLVEKAKVTLKVIKQGHAPKIRVATYKAKARQRKVKGHKQLLTTIKVESISA